MQFLLLGLFLSSLERWVGRDLKGVSACPKYDMAWELVNFLNVENNAVRM
jgi:hypothetical protein